MAVRWSGIVKSNQHSVFLASVGISETDKSMRHQGYEQAALDETDRYFAISPPPSLHHHHHHHHHHHTYTHLSCLLFPVCLRVHPSVCPCSLCLSVCLSVQSLCFSLCPESLSLCLFLSLSRVSVSFFLPLTVSACYVANCEKSLYSASSSPSSS